MDSALSSAITVTGTTVQLLAGGTIGELAAGEVAKTTVGGVGYNSCGTINANSSNIVVQAGGVTNGVSVDIVGSSINGLLTLTPHNVPSGLVLYNGFGMTQSAPPIIKDLSPMSGAAAIDTALTTPMAEPVSQSAFPSLNVVRAQATVSANMVVLVDPIVKVTGIGLSVFDQLLNIFQGNDTRQNVSPAVVVPATPQPLNILQGNDTGQNDGPATVVPATCCGLLPWRQLGKFRPDKHEVKNRSGLMLDWPFWLKPRG